MGMANMTCLWVFLAVSFAERRMFCFAKNQPHFSCMDCTLGLYFGIHCQTQKACKFSPMFSSKKIL